MKRLFRWIRNIIVGFILYSLLQVIVFKYIPVYFTPLMLICSYEQKSAGRQVIWEHRWVSLDSISAYLPQAVVASEDNLFLDHSGFDFDQIEKAREEAEKGKRVRGASTISQQTAKNVFFVVGKIIYPQRAGSILYSSD